MAPGRAQPRTAPPRGTSRASPGPVAGSSGRRRGSGPRRNTGSRPERHDRGRVRRRV